MASELGIIGATTNERCPLGGRVVRSKWCVAATMMTVEVHYHLDLVNGNARTILHLDNPYSASACVGSPSQV